MSLSSDFWNALDKKKKKELLNTGTTTTSKTTSAAKTTAKSATATTRSTNTTKRTTSNNLSNDFWANVDESNIAPVRDRITSRQTVTTKEKEKDEKKQKWFQKGAFEDGYQLGDVTKTILGTESDLSENLGAGVLGMGEKVVDAFATIAPYFEQAQFVQNGGYYNIEAQKAHDKAIEESKKELSKFVAKDLYNEEQIAKKIVSGANHPVKQLVGFDEESDSVFGEKSDSLAQSGGQLLATMGLQAVGVPWFLTTGATSFGGEAENAFNQGATYEEAALSSIISAGAEVLTEKLSGGIKFGGKALDDVLTQQISRGISKKFLRTASKLGLDMFGEGAEEWITEDLNKFGQWLTYRDEDELKELLFSEEAMDEKIDAFFGGALLGGVSNVGNAVKSKMDGVDYVSGLTEGEKKVVDRVYEVLLSEKEEKGKVTAKEKRKLYDRILRELDEGGISTDIIESVLDEEGYSAIESEKNKFFDSDTMKSYRDALANEDSQLKQLQKELDELTDAPNTVGNSKRYDEIVSKITELKENPGSTSIKAQLDQEVVRINELKNQLRTKVRDMVKDTKLGESYNELIRSQHKYDVDVSKYTDPNARKTIENILKSGKGDNSNHFHRYVDWLAQISADKGMSFSLTDNEALKGTEHDFSAEGLTVNGFKTADGIVLNMDSPKALNSTVGHEITHVLEQNTDLYKTLQESVFNYAIAKEGLDNFNKRLKALEEMYKGKEGTTAEAELTADLVGDYLFTDYDFVHRLSTENRNVFQKIYDEIKYLCKVVTAGSKEARELEKVKKAFEDAYRANIKGKPVAKTQHSLGYHAGDLGKAESYAQQGGYRGTGHFGTGTYFVGDEAKISGKDTYGNRPHESVEFDNYNLYKVHSDKVGYELHDNLRAIDTGFTQEFLEAAKANEMRVSKLREQAWDRTDSYDTQVWDDELEMYVSGDFIGNSIRAYTEVAQENNIEVQSYDEWLEKESGEVISPEEDDYDFYKSDYLQYLKETIEEADAEKNDGYESFNDAYFKLWMRFGKDNVNNALQKVIEHDAAMEQGGYDVQKTADSRATVFMKALGYEGIDVRGTGLDNTKYGSVIYDLKGKDAQRKAEIGTAKYSLSDSTGRQLTAEQSEFFKDSNTNPTSNPDIRYSLGEEITDEQNELGLDTKSEVQFSLSKDTEYMDNAIAKNNTSLRVDTEAMNAVKAMRERIATRMNDIKDRGLVGLPEDREGNTYIANSSYDGTEENTTICPRSLASEAFVDAVSEYLGRPLSVEEQIYISQDLQGRSLTPECTYCYVATDRKAYRAFLGDYVSQRDSVLQKLGENPNADVSRSGDLYKEFLNGRKDTNPMYSRFKMWVDAYKNGKPMIDASHLANINKLMGDIKSEFGAELKPQIVDAMKYAQSASWAKKRVNYVAYNGHILKWKQDRINKLNSHYGLRMYSFSDFHPAFVLENMQMITDASVRGLKMLGYTKDTDFVEIFAPSGMNINVSTFGFEADGNVYENNIIGAEWEKARALREQYPNVGVTFVATNDHLVNWALEQDWIDVVIPYHLVRTGAEVAKAFGYTNYTSESSDTKTKEWAKGDKKYIAPTEHNNDKATYLAALAKNHLNPRFERFIDNPNYMKLVNECRQPASESKPVQPTFNEDAAMVALAKLEANGYYQPIGGSVDRMYEIAAEVAENMQSQLAPAMSLSNNGEAPKQYGDWNVYGSDFGYNGDFAPAIPTPNRESVLPGERHSVDEMFPDEPDVSQDEYDNLVSAKETLESKMLEMSETGDFSELDTINEQWVEAVTRMQELEAELSNTDRLDSLTDADAPPEMDAPYYESEPTTLTKKATADIVRDVRTSLGLNNPQMADCKDIIERYRTGEIQTREQLIDALQDKFGSYTETISNEYLQEAKRDIRTRRVNVPKEVQHDIPDYASWMRHNRGKIIFSKQGLNPDELYSSLNEAYPDLFPVEMHQENSKVTPSDMLKRILDIADTPHIEEVERQKDLENIEEAADIIINGIGNFKMNQNLELSNRESKKSFESLMRQADRYAPADDIAPVAPSSNPTPGNPVAPTKTPTQKMQQSPKVAQALTESSMPTKRKSKAWSWVQEHVLDNGMVFENWSKKTNNRNLEAKWNFIRNSGARAQRLIGKGAKGVKSLTDIRKQVEKSGKTELFYNYMYHVHNIDRMTLADRFAGTPNKAVFGDTITADISQKEAARLLKQNPEFRQWSQDIYNFNNHLRKLLVDGGVISQETAALWQKMYPHYVPIGRVDQNGVNINVPLDTNKTGINAPVKRATGGNSDIRPLFDVMAERTLQTYRAIAKNNFGIELKNTLGSTVSKEAQTVDGVIDSLSAEEGLLKKGELGMSPTFTVFENGERVEFEITEEMYEAMKPTSDLLSSTSKVLNGVSNFRRGTLTEYNPWFLLKNAIKDQQDVLLNSQHPVKTYANMPVAIAEMMSGGEYYQEYLEAGGEQNTYFDNESGFEKNKAWEAVKWATGLNEIAWANNKIEMLPRLAEYIASRKAGRSVEVSMLDAARVTTNFAAGGDVTKFVNRNGATFLNASVQGAIQQVRNIREAKQNGVKGVLGLAAKYLVAGLPAVLLNNLLWEDDEEYEDLADYVKRDYYIVGKFDDGKFVRIPKGRGVAVIQYAMERMDDVRTGDDESDMKTFLDIAWDTLMLAKDNVAPNNPLDNNIISPITQVLTNKTWYGEDLIPSRLQDVPAAEQYDESTDDISRWIGESTNTSPMKWNYLLDQYSGVLGDTFLPMLTPEAESGDDTTLGTMTAPLRDMFTTDSVINNQISGDFYDTKDLIDMAANSSKATEEDKMKSTYMQSVSWELSDLYKEKREIQNSNMADSAKYKYSRDIQKQINEIMENAMGGYENVSIDGLYSEVGDKRFNHDAESGKWYEIKPKNADGSANWYYQKEQEVTKGLGISYEEYWNNREEYNYAYDKPEKYTLSKAVGGYKSYRSYTQDLYDIKADKDSNGKSISGSRKKKVLDYVNNMNADYGEKIILFKSEYPADDTYNYDIIDYLNSRDDISFAEMNTILKELGFNVDSKGYITW